MKRAKRFERQLRRGFVVFRRTENIEKCKGVQPLNNYTRRFRPSSLKQADESGLDGLQTGK